jgi:hypothetical protein
MLAWLRGMDNTALRLEQQSLHKTIVDKVHAAIIDPGHIDAALDSLVWEFFGSIAPLPRKSPAIIKGVFFFVRLIIPQRQHWTAVEFDEDVGEISFGNLPHSVKEMYEAFKIPYHW